MPAETSPRRLRVLSFEPLGGFGGMDVYDHTFHAALTERADLDLTWATSDRNAGESLPYELWTPFRDVFGTGTLAGRGARYARGLWQLVRRAAREARRGPVVVHQQFLTVPLLELAAMTAAQAAGVPWILTPHEAIPHSGTRRDVHVRRRMYRQADALVALSQANRRDLLDLVGESRARLELIPHGHLNDFRGPDASVDQSTARTRLGFDVDAPTVLFLGELRPIKGLVHLLHAMARVREEIPNARLVVAGRPYREDPRQFDRLIDELGLRPAVTARWGFVPTEELPLYHRAADVVALPYLGASQSGACLTAYAYRRPVVASAVGGLREQVIEGATGMLVPPADPAALATALVRVLRSRDDAAAMGERGYQWAERERAWPEIARRTAELYWSAWLRRHPQPPA